MKNIILILAVFLTYSCKEDPQTTSIEGVVVNAGSKEPVEGVRVILSDGLGVKDNFFNNSASTGSSKFVEKYSDINGKFNISIDGEDPHLYLFKDGYEFVYFRYGSSDNFKVYSSGNEYKDEILGIWAEAFFCPILKGNNCINTDTICFGEGKSIPSYFLLKNEVRGLGKGPIIPYGGNGLYSFGDKYYIYWMKYQIKGVWHEKIDSVFIKSFTTYTDTIYY